jgi:hypothetical protein
MPGSTDAELEARIRSDESTLYTEYGLPHTEHTVRVADPAVDGRDLALPLLPLLGDRRILAVDWFSWARPVLASRA